MAGVDIERTSIWADIRDVIQSGKKPVRFKYLGTIHSEKEDCPIYKISNIDNIRDYANNIGEVIHITFIIGMGDYMSRIYPFKDNLEFTIKRIEQEESSTDPRKNAPILVERYKAIFLTEENPILRNSDLDLYDTETLNKTQLIDVHLQLLPRSLEPLRLKTLGGIFRNCTQKRLIHNLVGGESIKVLVDGKPAIDGIDIVEPDNTDIVAHAVIPHGMHMTSIPTYLQERINGVYNAGIGTFLQTFNGKKIWFIYPVFDHRRFDKTSQRVIIYGVPQEKLQGIDRTYRKDGNIMHIVATAGKKYQDHTDIDSVNLGSGFKMPDARSMMKKPVELTVDGPKGNRARLNHEVVMTERNDGINYAPMSTQGPSGNPFLEYSKIISRHSGRIDLVWENSDPEIIYPGMPCKYTFLENDVVVELKGTIVFIQTLSSLQGSTVSGNTYKNVSTIVMTVEQKRPVRAVPKINNFGVSK